MIIIGLSHLGLFLFSLFFFIPRRYITVKLSTYYQLFIRQSKYFLIIIAVVLIHLVEVNILDTHITTIVGIDMASTLQTIENGFVYWFSQHWTPLPLYFFVAIYIIVYPFTLWFSPFYCIVTNNSPAMKTLAYGLLFIYIIALPFYLFLPVTNVYTFYGSPSSLETVLPSVNTFFYSTTTMNNCLPSLHVAVALLIAKTVSVTKNKRLMIFTYGCSFCVILSVIYLSIHWLTDVLCGIAVAFGVFYILHKRMQEEQEDAQII